MLCPLGLWRCSRAATTYGNRNASGARPPIRGAETVRRPGARLCSLGFAITGRSVSDERIEKLARRLLDLLHRPAECHPVCFGGARETTQLAHHLQGCLTDL